MNKLVIVCVLGLDGAGKTTLIESLLERANANGVPVARRHFRPFRILKRQHMQVNEADFTSPANAARSPATNTARLILFLLDYWIDHILLLTNQAKPTIVIYDRYFYDILVDPVRYRVSKGFIDRLITNAVAKFVPRPDILVALTPEIRTIRERRPSCRRSDEELEQMLLHYRTIGEKFGCSHSDLDKVFSNIIQKLES